MVEEETKEQVAHESRKSKRVADRKESGKAVVIYSKSSRKKREAEITGTPAIR